MIVPTHFELRESPEPRELNGECNRDGRLDPTLTGPVLDPASLE